MDTVPESTCRNPILVVEDDTDSRVMLATVLTLQNYRVVTAANGEEGIAMARQHRPCIILLDLMMPVMDGEEFRAAQLDDPEIRDIPVVLVTAAHDGSSRAQSMGALCCIKKPLSLKEVTAHVTTYCSTGR
jgi:CheY-like chemotaxis protein